MKRAIFALLSTVAGVVYILTYKTVPLESAPAASAPAGARTIKGETVQVHDHGPLTVTITVAGGKVSQATAVQESTSARSFEISARAIPELNRVALTARTDGFDTVSGATMTSDAYEKSLQSALDQL